MTAEAPCRPRVRFVLVGHPDYPNEVGRRFAVATAKELAASGIDTGSVGEAATTKPTAVVAARKALADAPDAVVVYVGTWLEAPVAVAAVREMDGVPLLVWAFPMVETPAGRESTGSFVAQLVLRGVLKRMRRNARFLTGLPDDEACLAEAAVFIRAAAAFRRLRQLTVGLVGYASMGMYTGVVDPVALRSALGLDLDHVDTYTLIQRAEALGDAEVDGEVARLEKLFAIGADIEVAGLRVAAALGIALRRLATERCWQAATVKCQYELSQEYGMTACLAVSLLAETGVVAGCEGDVSCVAAQALLAQFTTEPVWYADVLDFDEESVLLSPCGFAPPSLAAADTRPRLGCFQHPGFAGIYVSAQLKAGKVTLAQLCPLGGRFTLLAVAAEGERCPLRQGWAPALRVRFAGTSKAFLEGLTSQHVAVAYGDHAAELAELGALAEVDRVGEG